MVQMKKIAFKRQPADKSELGSFEGMKGEGKGRGM